MMELLKSIQPTLSSKSIQKPQVQLKALLSINPQISTNLIMNLKHQIITGQNSQTLFKRFAHITIIENHFMFS